MSRRRVEQFGLLLAALLWACFPVAPPLAAQEHAPAAHPAGDHGPAAHAEGHAADAAQHGGGHDEEYTIWSDLPLWSGIAFILFVIAIRQLGLWNLLLTSMAERERTENEAIALSDADLAEARAILRQARGRMEALDEGIRETLAEGNRDTKTVREQILAHAQQESDLAVARVRHEIERVRDHSLNELFSSLAEQVAAVTEQRLRSGLSAEDQNRLIDDTLGQLSIR